MQEEKRLPLLPCYGNENWEFDENGLMKVRFASINDLAELSEMGLYDDIRSSYFRCKSRTV